MLPSKRHFISAQVSSGGLFLDLDGEVDHGDDNGRNAPRHTSELAPQQGTLVTSALAAPEEERMMLPRACSSTTPVLLDCLPQSAEKRPCLEVGG